MRRHHIKNESPGLCRGFVSYGRAPSTWMDLSERVQGVQPLTQQPDHVSLAQHGKKWVLGLLIPQVLFLRRAAGIAEHLIRHVLVAQADPYSGAQVNRQRTQAHIHLFRHISVQLRVGVVVIPIGVQIGHALESRRNTAMSQMLPVRLGLVVPGHEQFFQLFAFVFRHVILAE